MNVEKDLLNIIDSNEVINKLAARNKTLIICYHFNYYIFFQQLIE